MKEIKTTRLEIRLTPTEKELIKEYAAARNMTMSEAVKNLCVTIF